MKRDSSFKYVFWSLLVVMVLLIMAVASMVLTKSPDIQDKKVLFLILPFIIIFVYIVVVGRLVYKDAEKRGMDPWLWATVAVFVPNLIGVIIYLIARYNVKNTCINCGKGIQVDFKICPYCGHKQDLVCGNCQKVVSPEWTVCPYCAQPLAKAA